MTTVCTDGRSMASDGLSTANDTVNATNMQKVFKLDDGSVVGIAGCRVDALRAVDALRRGDTEFVGDYNLLRLHPGGRVERYDRCLYPLATQAPAAIGSGGDLALGALEAGASPKEAVRIASRRDAHSGGRIREISPTI